MALTESFSFSEFGVDPGNRDDGSEASPSSLVLLGKFLSNKPPSRHTIMAVLKRAWESFEGWTMVELAKGTFQFSFKLAKDRDCALSRRPWTIRGALLLLERWPDHLQLEEIHFSSCPVWIRLAGLPPAMLADSPLSRIARLFGEVSEKRAGKKAKFVASARFRAVINVSLALKPGFFLDRPNLPSIWVQAHYENIGHFCFRCGLLGHGASDCLAETEILVDKAGFPAVPLYGEWLAADSTVASCFTNGGRPCSAARTALPSPNGPESPTVGSPSEVRTTPSLLSRQGRPVATTRVRSEARRDTDTTTLGHTTIPREKGTSTLSSSGDSPCLELVDVARHPSRATKSRPKKPTRKTPSHSETEPRADRRPADTPPAGYPRPSLLTPCATRGSSAPDPPTAAELRVTSPLTREIAPRGTLPPATKSTSAPRGTPPSTKVVSSYPREALSPEDPPLVDSYSSPGRAKRLRMLEPPGSADQSRPSMRPSPIRTRSSSRQDLTLKSAARALRAVRTP